jgi:tetratricopeptide (TPR) repeat protein
MLAALIRIIGLFSMLALLTGTVSAQSSQTLEVQANADTRQLLRDAESQIARNDSAAAFALLSPREAELAGNAYYDYLLGVAALDTGRISEAIFSLQRSLAVEPRFSGARLELARAHFEAGNNAQARPLFVALLDESPPAGVRTVLNQYIDAIDAKPAAPSSRFTPYFEVTAGHDSNANGSTSDQQFLGFNLSPNNVETPSSFGELAAGFNWSVPSSASAAWYMAARASYRHNPDASFVDPSVLSGLTGFTWRRGAFFGRAGIDGYWALRDGESNETYAGLNVLLSRGVSDRWDLTLGLRAGAMRFDEAIEVLDVDRIMYALGASYRFSSLSSLSIEAVGGQDSEKQAGSPYGNSKAGGRLSLTAPLGSSYLFASIGSLTSDFDGLFFGVPREDTQTTALLQLEFRDIFTTGLSIVPRVRYVDNDSDVALYKYDRTEFGLMIRWMPR